MKEIVIGQPHIVEKENVTRMEALIKGAGFEHIYFFEVEKKYGEYFCYERCDAFLLGMLYFALVNECNIICEAPVSEKLYYQITDTYIPTIVNNDSELFHTISIEARLDDMPIKNIGAVGASASGGIDSFYTITKNMNGKAKNYNITHLLLTNSFNIYYDEKNTRERFADICENAQKIADELGVELVKIYSNEQDFWYRHYVDLFCFRYASLPYALQKLYAVYHYSTGYRYNDFTFKAINRDASHYDFFTVHMISNENLTFYSSGGEIGRPGKALLVAENPVAQKRLTVCNLHSHNCSVCEKCLRTQFNLYACNKLELFKDSFEINEFYKRKDSTLAKMLYVQGSFERENIEFLKKNNIKIPLKVKIIGNIGHIFYIFKQSAKKSKVICFLYRLIVPENKDETLVGLEKYNMELSYAKKCNPDTISYE